MRIKAGGDIVNARGAGFPNFSGVRNLQLESGSQNIGSAAAPIDTIISGNLDVARAAGSIWLQQIGTLRVGNVFAGGSINLSAVARYRLRIRL